MLYVITLTIIGLQLFLNYQIWKLRKVDNNTNLILNSLIETLQSSTNRELGRLNRKLETVINTLRKESF